MGSDTRPRGLRSGPAQCVLLALVLALAIQGCAGTRPRFEPGVWEPTTGVPIGAAAAESLATLIRGQAARIRSVRGSAELLIRRERDAPPRKLLVSLASRRPDEARLRGRFGLLATVFDLRVSGDSLELYLPRDGVSVAGPLAEWGEAPFPGAQSIVELLLPAPLPAGAADPGHWRRTRLGWEVSLLDADGAGRRLTYETKKLRLVRQQILAAVDSGRDDLDVYYGRHRSADGIVFPGELRVGSSRRPELCELRFSSTTLNGDIPEALFRLQIPPDARRVPPGEIEWRLSDESEGGE